MKRRRRRRARARVRPGVYSTTQFIGLANERRERRLAANGRRTKASFFMFGARCLFASKRHELRSAHDIRNAVSGQKVLIHPVWGARRYAYASFQAIYSPV